MGKNLPLKQRIVFVVALVIALSAANLLAHWAGRFNPYRSAEFDFTAGLEAVPVVFVAVRTLNFVSLGYVERADQRGHWVRTGRLSREDERAGSVVDIILSISAVACAVMFARRAAASAIRDV